MINNILYETDTKYSPIYWKTEYTSKYCPLQVRKKNFLIIAMTQIRIPFSGGKK